MTGPLTSTGAIQADPEALLKAANILRTQAADLRRSSYDHGDLKVRNCGSDPISLWATQAFNEKIQPIAESVPALMKLLEAASEQLVETAKSYGATDQQAAAAFAKLDHGQTLQQQLQQKAGHSPVGHGPTWHSL